MLGDRTSSGQENGLLVVAIVGSFAEGSCAGYYHNRKYQSLVHVLYLM